MCRVFDSLIGERKMRNLIGASGRGKQRGYTVARSREYTPSPLDPEYLTGRGSDAVWIRRFAQDGGTVIISGNVEMMKVPQEVMAIQATGMIAFYFQSAWNRWDFFEKSSLLLWHWPLLINTVKYATRGDVYRIPASFSKIERFNLVLRSGQLELLTDAPHVDKTLAKARKKLTKSGKAKRPDGQGNLHLPGSK